MPVRNPADIAAHAALTTGVHGVGPGTIGSFSTANKTIYVDKAAAGAGDGTSWADAFTTIQAAVDSLEDIILHAYTIKVRKGATPYRETVYLNSNPAVNPSHLILGTLTIEAEYYWYGDCEANVGGAGEITDTGAFANVAIGDKVYILDLNGADGRAQDYEVCTVDSIANAPNRIGTDGAKTPSTAWRYVITRTEISGSDDGTDAGTARSFIFTSNAINNITINGFYLTFSGHWAIWLSNSRLWTIRSCIASNCDRGVRVERFSTITLFYTYINATVYYALNSSELSYAYGMYSTFNCPQIVLLGESIAFLRGAYCYIPTGVIGLSLNYNSMGYLYRGTIAAAVTNGVEAAYNSAAHLLQTTNSAATPETPAGTVEGAYIG